MSGGTERARTSGSRDFRERLCVRAQRAGVEVADDELNQLEVYFTLLAKWNARINLTALPLNPPTDETVDRLIVEALAAARYFPKSHVMWFDLGSGNGSPALPLKMIRPAAALTMIEARARRVAFLREVVSVIGLRNATVANGRFEALADRYSKTAGFVTVRAVKIDAALAQAAAHLAAPEGRLLLFRSDPNSVIVPGFETIETVELVPDRRSYLSVYRYVGG